MLSILLLAALAAIDGVPLKNAANSNVNMPLCGLGTGGYGNGVYQELGQFSIIVSVPCHLVSINPSPNTHLLHFLSCRQLPRVLDRFVCTFTPFLSHFSIITHYTMDASKPPYTSPYSTVAATRRISDHPL